ncbi:MAG: MinD/ParA family protein [Woeseiaceae bacterium]|nr:MinD/ParA family protein [Woeseiaceae bacterium]
MPDRSQHDNLKSFLNRQAVKVLAVCSGKGGVGKTNVAANVALAMAAKHHNVCLLDADVSLANVDVLLGLQPRFNLSHVVHGEIDLEAAVLKAPHGLRIVPASSGNFSMTDLAPAGQAAIIQAFGQMSDQPDVLVIDTAAGISPGVARFVQAAQHAVVVVCDEPASLTDAYALIKVFSRNYGISHFQVITNMSTSNAAGRLLFDKLNRVAERYLDVVLRHLGDVPRDEYLVKAVQQQRAVVDSYPNSASGNAFRRIAGAVERLPAPTRSRGGIEFFFERLFVNERQGQGAVV